MRPLFVFVTISVFLVCTLVTSRHARADAGTDGGGGSTTVPTDGGGKTKPLDAGDPDAGATTTTTDPDDGGCAIGAAPVHAAGSGLLVGAGAVALASRRRKKR